MKKGFEVVLLRNRFADREERFELPFGMLNRSGGGSGRRKFGRIRHEMEDNTRFGEVTTNEGQSVQRRRFSYTRI